MGDQGQASASFSPEMVPNSLHRRQGGAQGLSGRVRKIFNPIGIRGQDRQARSELLYRLQYPGPQFQA